VLLDWSQNHPAKTTVTPYSLRGGERPYVAAPRSWQEMEAAAPTQLDHVAVMRRLAVHGDLLVGLAEPGPRLPAGRSS
jgi:bifunctional non-homologous end joining protein LigD